MTGPVLLAGLHEKPAHGSRSGDASPGGVDAFEKIFLGGLSGDVGEERRSVAFALRGAHGLALVQAAALARDLRVGFAEHRIVLANVDPKAVFPGCCGLHHSAGEGRNVTVETFRLPGFEPLLDLTGELDGVAGCFKGDDRKLADCRVLSMTAAEDR